MQLWVYFICSAPPEPFRSIKNSVITDRITSVYIIINVVRNLGANLLIRNTFSGVIRSTTVDDDVVGRRRRRPQVRKHVLSVPQR